MSEYIDNQTQRKERLKVVLKQLHEGRTVDEVKAEFSQLLQDVGPGEIAEIEQALIAEGMPEQEIKRLCDVHVAVFRDSLEVQEKPETVPGHPVHTFRAENDAVGEVLDALDGAIRASDWQDARAQLAKLREYEVHYVRKENILFPYLEKHGFSGPSTVMWGIHDDIRAAWKRLDEVLSGAPNQAQVEEVFNPLSTAIRDMVYKEDNILFPTAMQKLSQEEWAAIRDQEAEVGYGYVQPGSQWLAKTAAAGLGTLLTQAQAAVEGRLSLKTGALTLQEVTWLLTHLPLDITYVDKDDTVRFFSETRERIFPRSPAIIGRKVQQCHPPASVHRVQQILNDFRAGKRDEAEFWIQMKGMFVHIRYFAIRNERGGYQGTVEVTQDVSGIRALEGERRLLDEAE